MEGGTRTNIRQDFLVLVQSFVAWLLSVVMPVYILVVVVGRRLGVETQAGTAAEPAAEPAVKFNTHHDTKSDMKNNR